MNRLPPWLRIWVTPGLPSAALVALLLVLFVASLFVEKPLEPTLPETPPTRLQEPEEPLDPPDRVTENRQLETFSEQASESPPEQPDTSEPRLLFELDHAADDIAYSPDGSALASGGTDGTVRLWDSESGDLLSFGEGHQVRISEPGPIELPLVGEVYSDGLLKGTSSLTFSPDGRVLASGGVDGRVIFWEARSGAKLQTVQVYSRDAGRASSVRDLEFSPDGRLLASGSVDRAGVRFLDARSGLHLGDSGKKSVLALDFSPCGKYVAFASDSLKGPIWIEIWNGSGEREAVLTAPIPRTLGWALGGGTTIEFSPTGEYLAAASGEFNEILVWNVVDRTVRLKLVGHEDRVDDAFGDGGITSRGVQGIAYSPSGKYLFSAGADGTVRIWDTQAGALIRAIVSDSPWSIALTPDGTRMAVATTFGIEIWSLGHLYQ